MMFSQFIDISFLSNRNQECFKSNQITVRDIASPDDNIDCNWATVSLNPIPSYFVKLPEKQCNHLLHNMDHFILTEILKVCHMPIYGKTFLLKSRLGMLIKRVRKLMSVTDKGKDKSKRAPSVDSFDFFNMLTLEKPIVLKPKCSYRYIFVIDFEATCKGESRKLQNEQTHEIIEFPCLCYDTTKLRCVSLFHSYCKPTHKPQLTNFCQNLTGISQDIVDVAPIFPQVLNKFEAWLKSTVGEEIDNFVVLCDCDADIGKFMRIQCRLLNTKLPSWCEKWINLGNAFRDFYKVHSFNQMALLRMLNMIGIEFEGVHHSGLYDCLNIMRIMETMLRDGYEFYPNRKYHPGRPPNYSVSLSYNDRPLRITTESARPKISKAEEQSLLWLEKVRKSRKTRD